MKSTILLSCKFNNIVLVVSFFEINYFYIHYNSIRMKNKILIYLPGILILFFNYKLAILYSMSVSIFFLVKENSNFLKRKG